MSENRMEVADRLMKAFGALRSVADDIRYGRHPATVLAASVRAIAEEVRTAARDVPALREAGTGRGGEAEVPGIVLRDLSPDEAQARAEALADARRRERDADRGRTSQTGSAGHE